MRLRFILLISFILSFAQLGRAEKLDRVHISSVKNAIRYMKANKLPTKLRFEKNTLEVKVRVGKDKFKKISREIKRVFVPIIIDGEKNTSESFIKHLVGSSKGTMGVLANTKPNSHRSGYDHYVRAVMSPKHVIASYYDTINQDEGRTHRNEKEAKRYLQLKENGRYPVVNLGKGIHRGLEKFWYRWHLTNSYGNDAKSYIQDRKQSAENNPQVIPGNTSADCMWWFSNGEPMVKGRVKGYRGNYLSDLKLKGSSPQNIPAIMIHAAKSNKVTVVGVGVRSLDEFNRMSKEELFSGKPEGYLGSYIRPTRKEVSSAQ